jgi:putative ABC transport system permease protein
MRAGNVEDLRLPNAVIVDQVAIAKFAKRGIALKLGSTFEINDKEARVVGICETERSFLGQPYVFTTYSRALEYSPPQRKLLSFVLVQPKAGVSVPDLLARISGMGGLRAFSSDQLKWDTFMWYVKNTGIPISFGTVVISICSFTKTCVSWRLSRRWEPASEHWPAWFSSRLSRSALRGTGWAWASPQCLATQF